MWFSVPAVSGSDFAPLPLLQASHREGISVVEVTLHTRSRTGAGHLVAAVGFDDPRIKVIGKKPQN